MPLATLPQTKRPEERGSGFWVNIRFGSTRTLGTTLQVLPIPGDIYVDQDDEEGRYERWVVQRREFHPHYIAIILEPE